jgi:hypothetical protein
LEQVDEEVEKLEKWEKIKKYIVIVGTAVLLLSYVIYTFPHDIRSVAGIKSEIRSISITTDVMNPGVDGTDKTENKISTSDPKTISEIMNIFDNYQYRLKLDHGMHMYYDTVTNMQIFIGEADNSYAFIHMVSDGSIYICRKKHNDYYHIGIFDNGRAIELFNQLNDYANQNKNQSLKAPEQMKLF